MKAKLTLAVIALLAALAMHNTLKLLFEGICIGVVLAIFVTSLAKRK